MSAALRSSFDVGCADRQHCKNENKDAQTSPRVYQILESLFKASGTRRAHQLAALLLNGREFATRQEVQLSSRAIRVIVVVRDGWQCHRFAVRSFPRRVRPQHRSQTLRVLAQP